MILPKKLACFVAKDLFNIWFDENKRICLTFPRMRKRWRGTKRAVVKHVQDVSTEVPRTFKEHMTWHDKETSTKTRHLHKCSSFHFFFLEKMEPIRYVHDKTNKLSLFFSLLKFDYFFYLCFSLLFFLNVFQSIYLIP